MAKHKDNNTTPVDPRTLVTEIDREHGYPNPCVQCGLPWSEHHGYEYWCPRSETSPSKWPGANYWDRSRTYAPPLGTQGPLPADSRDQFTDEVLRLREENAKLAAALRRLTEVGPPPEGWRIDSHGQLVGPRDAGIVNVSTESTLVWLGDDQASIKTEAARYWFALDRSRLAEAALRVADLELRSDDEAERLTEAKTLAQTLIDARPIKRKS